MHGRWLRSFLLLILSVCSAAVVVGSVKAADFEERIAPTETEWKLLLSPYVWGASLKGDASLAGFNTDVDVPFSDTFKHLDFAFMGQIDITNSIYGFYLDGQYVKTSQDQEVGTNTLGLKITTTNIAAGAYYRVYEADLGGATVFNAPRLFTVEPTIGARWTQLKTTVDAFGLSATKKADWTDPFVGVRLSADLNDRWNLWGQADIGGFGVGSRLSYNAQAYLGYRTMVLDKPVILRFGYRVFSQDYESDDFTGNKFKWDVIQHGPVIGMTMRF